MSMKTLLFVAVICLLPVSGRAEEKQPVKCLGHEGFVGSVALSADGKLAVSGSDDQTLRFWDTSNGKPIQVVRPINPPKQGPWVGGVRFSPDGKTVAAVVAGVPRFWDARAVQEINTLPAIRSEGYDLAFSPDGRRLAVAAQDDVQVWDLQTGRKLYAFKCGDDLGRSWRVAFSPDGKRLAAALHSSGGEKHERFPVVRVWDLDAGKEIFAGWKGGTAQAVAFSPNGRFLIAGGTLAEGTGEDGVLEVWDLAEPTAPRTVCKVRADRHVVFCLAISPDGKTIATGGNDPAIKLWNATTGELLGKLEGHTGQVHSLAFSSDGKTLASAGGDKQVLIWRLAPR
jgi:WD40 repeat protein